MTLTLAKVREAAKQIVAEKPDFVYREDNCAYVPASHEFYPFRQSEVRGPGRETGCIVGEILFRLGALTPKVMKSQKQINILIRNDDVQVENEKVSSYLTVLQEKQDNGLPWATALSTAERWLAGED